MPDIILLENSREIIKWKFYKHHEDPEGMTLSHTNLIPCLGSVTRMDNRSEECLTRAYAHFSLVIAQRFFLFSFDTGGDKWALQNPTTQTYD